MILAGDIGGTKTNVALFDDELRRLRLESFVSRDHASLNEIVRKFRSEDPGPVDRAAFGIAGAVVNGRCKTTNLPWIVDSVELASEIGVPRVGLINDLEANAWGIESLAPSDFVILNAGAPGARGNQAVIAAGTGLGEAGLYWDGTTHRPFACEGGHANFAPASALEIDLLRYLMGRFDHVSWERVVSGPGLFNVYSFLRDTGRGEESASVAERMKTEDPSAVVSQSALDGSDALSWAALDLFARLYGAEAGNLALKIMATGGIFLGGGVAPRILEKLKDGEFMQAFRAKGPMKALVESIPVRVILNDKTALLGAARYARLGVPSS